MLATLQVQAKAELCSMSGAIEYEADLGYPGAPPNRESQGGNTTRRFLLAHQRHDLFRSIAFDRNLARVLRLFTNRHDLVFTPNHHNCVMTKHPGYSSTTYWHQDIRYWHFQKSDLVTMWLALTSETAVNGALKVIPRSHHLIATDYDLDEKGFLVADSDKNQELTETAEQMTLSPGDALFFHSRMFHGANKNTSQDTKLSLVMTFHTSDNQPIANTRSATFPEIPLNK